MISWQWCDCIGQLWHFIDQSCYCIGTWERRFRTRYRSHASHSNLICDRLLQVSRSYPPMISCACHSHMSHISPVITLPNCIISFGHLLCVRMTYEAICHMIGERIKTRGYLQREAFNIHTKLHASICDCWICMTYKVKCGVCGCCIVAMRPGQALRFYGNTALLTIISYSFGGQLHCSIVMFVLLGNQCRHYSVRYLHLTRVYMMHTRHIS